MNPTIKRISLWSGPRNISTALMYSFAQRKDTKVFDEPLYAYYLKNSKADQYHPGASEIIQTMETDGDKLIQEMLTNSEKPILFFKNMTHHLLNLDRSFLQNLINIILTRNPAEMLPSFSKVVENPSMDDVGYRAQFELVDQLNSKGIPVIVLDSKSLLLNPEDKLKKLCSMAGIPFVPAMLQWEPGARPEDGCWAPYWYSSVHRSTGFVPYQPKTEPFPDYLRPLLEDCQPYYEKLQAMTL